MNYFLNRECEMVFQLDCPKGRHQYELCSIEVVVYARDKQVVFGFEAFVYTRHVPVVRKKNDKFLVCLGTWFESVSGWGLIYKYKLIYIILLFINVIKLQYMLVHNTISSRSADMCFSTQWSYSICVIIVGWVSKCKHHFRYFNLIF